MESKEISFRSKEAKALPKGAKITSKRCSISVEEIENGFLEVKSWDIDYTMPGKEDRQYFYKTTKTYHETNPMLIDGKDPLDSF